MKNTLIGIVVAVIVIIVAVVAFGGKKETVSTPTPTTSSSASPLVSAEVSIGVSVPKTVTITYTDSGYGTPNMTVKSGDTIKFINSSTKDMWPASAVHPTHDVYPEKGTCFSGIFTGCTVAPEGSFSMKFNAVGTWQYHDHRTPSKTGSITVTN